MTRSKLIVGAQVLTGDAQDNQGRLDILIEDAHIARIGKDLPQNSVDEVIQAQELVAMPGLVQAHVHLCQTLFRSQAEELDRPSFLQQRIWPMEAALDADSLRAAARLGLAEVLLGGTTAVLDMGSVHHTDVLFEEALRLGIRYTGGKTIMDQGHGFAQSLREPTVDALAQSHALCKRWHKHTSGRLNYAFSPRSVLNTSAEALSGCATLAREHGALLHTHAAESTEEVAQVRTRHACGNVEYLERIGFLGPDVVLAHGIWMSGAEQQLLRKNKTSIAHCPSSNLKLASGMARIEALHKMGINIALGADAAACNNNLDGFLEMRLAALLLAVHGGPQAITAREAFYMATRGGALATGHSEGGYLAAGMHADIVLMDLNRAHAWPEAGELVCRLVYSAKSSDVDTVFVHGEPCVRRRRLVHGREASILKHATGAAALVRGKMGLA